MSGDNPKFYEGTLVGEVNDLIKVYPDVFSGAFWGLAKPALLHPNAETEIENGHYLHLGKVARLDSSVSMQRQLLAWLFEHNEALAEEFGMVGKDDEMYAEGDIKTLQKFPDLLPTLLSNVKGLEIPPANSADISSQTYNPNDPRTRAFSSEQLSFIEQQDLRGGSNVAPNAIAAALLGLALRHEMPVYYSYTRPSTHTAYIYGGEEKVMRTPHHILLPTQPPVVFDVSARSGRIVRRNTK